MIDKSEAKQFIYKFETDQNKYVYDINTMQIVRLEQVAWNIISDFGSLSKDEIVCKYAGQYSSEEILSAYNEIANTSRLKGLFSARRPEILFPFTEENLRQKLAKDRKMLLLNVTEDCNFRCLYCVYSGKYVNRHAYSKRQMSWDVAKKAIDDFLPCSDPEDRSIGFYGGEPLLNIDLIRKCVAYVRQVEGGSKVTFSLTTNGSLLTGEKADFLACENFNIGLSLDGPCEIHDRYRQTKEGLPTWERIISNLKAFLDKYAKYREEGGLILNIVMAPPLNVLELDNFCKSVDIIGRGILIIALGLNEIPYRNAFIGSVEGRDTLYEKFLNNMVTGEVNHDTFNPAYRLQRSLFEQQWVLFHKRFELYSSGLSCLPDKFCILSTCIPGVRRIFVSVDGDYLVCERVPENDYYKIGSVDDGFDVAKIWRLLNEWVELTREECKYCWCLRTCKVGCWSNISDGEKPTAILKSQACEAHRRGMHGFLIDYCSVLERNPRALDYMKDITVS